MIRSQLFFKKPEMRDKQYTHNDMMRDAYSDKYSRVNNSGVRPFEGHPRYGFHTMLNTDSFAKLPTAPAIVGGNTDWTKSKVTPATEYLRSVLSVGRPMMPAPALGSFLKLGEPSINSIHTTY